VKQKRIRLSVITDKFFPLNTASAIRIKALRDAWAASGYFDITVFTATVIENNEHVKHVKSFFLAPSNKSNKVFRLWFEFLLGAEYFFRLLFHRTDLVFISSPPFVVAVLSSFATRIRKIPYIFDVRDLYPEVYFSANILNRNSFISRAIIHLEKSVYQHSFFVTTVTKGLQKHIQEKCGEMEHVYLVRNGYIEKLIDNVSTDKKNEKFTVIFHGNLGTFQDVDLILRLAQKCVDESRDIEFVIIGEGSKDYILKKTTIPNVTYLSRLGIEQVYNKISKAHVGISFRKDNFISCQSFPVKLYEYIGIGLPMIITPKCEAGELIEQYQIGYQFAPFDLELIYSKIVELSENQLSMNKLLENISSIRHRFSREKIAEHFTQLLIYDLKHQHMIKN